VTPPASAPTDQPAVELAHYSRALDEIWRLRALLAYEANVLGAHVDYACFPKSRRPVAERSMERMRRSSRGQSEAAMANVPSTSLKGALSDAAAEQCLTRAMWEAEAP
jgi:hypothetical protein